MHRDELASLGAGEVVAVDASAYFSRPGPRIVDGLELLAHILHPELVPENPARRPGRSRWRSERHPRTAPALLERSLRRRPPAGDDRRRAGPRPLRAARRPARRRRPGRRSAGGGGRSHDPPAQRPAPRARPPPGAGRAGARGGPRRRRPGRAGPAPGRRARALQHLGRARRGGRGGGWPASPTSGTCARSTPAFGRVWPAYRRLLLTARALPCVSRATAAQFGGSARGPR